MVQTAQDRRGDHLRVFGKAMTGGRELIRVGHRLWNARSQAGVWTTSIVVGHPFTKGAPEMGLVHRDQPIETLPTYRADQSLAERVRLRRPRGRLQHMPSHRADRLIDRRRIDAVPIVEDEPVGRLRGDDRAELLDRPRRRRMRGDVPVQDPTRADLEDDEDVEDPETDGHRRAQKRGTSLSREALGHSLSNLVLDPTGQRGAVLRRPRQGACMKMRATAIAAMLMFVAYVHAAVQQPNPDIQKIARAIQAAFNNGDAKALGALYTTEALRIGSTGGFFQGRAAIEKDAAESLAGRYKGMKLVLQSGKTQMLTPDVAVNEGTFEMTGGAPLCEAVI